MYVTDYHGHNVIKVDIDGTTSVFAGSSVASTAVTNANGMVEMLLQQPCPVQCIFGAIQLASSDKKVRRINTKKKKKISTIAGTGGASSVDSSDNVLALQSATQACGIGGTTERVLFLSHCAFGRVDMLFPATSAPTSQPSRQPSSQPTQTPSYSL